MLGVIIHECPYYFRELCSLLVHAKLIKEKIQIRTELLKLEKHLKTEID
jgi:hypothetical protein